MSDFKKENETEKELWYHGLRMTDEHARHLQQLVKRASEVDMNYEVFGAKSHKYVLNEPIELECIERFNKNFECDLPEEYVFFLTKVGNGGAGPHYGIFDFKKMIEFNVDRLKMKNEEHISKWCDEKVWHTLMTELDDVGDEECLAFEEKLYSGIMILGTQGCSYDTLMILNGMYKGKVVYIDWSLEPDQGPQLVKQDFLEWYEQFFIKVSLGESVKRY